MNVANIKGTIFRNTVKYIRSQKERGKALVPERLQHYLQGRILATSWLPEQDHLELMGVAAELFAGQGGSDSLEAWEEMTRASSSAFYNATYRTLVNPTAPARSLATFPTMWKLRHDTGEIETETIGPTEGVVRLTGYAIVSAKMCASTTGSLESLLDHSGATEVEIAHPQCTAHGDEACEWRLRWKNPAS